MKERDTDIVKTNVFKKGKSTINAKANMFISKGIIASVTSNLVISEMKITM